MTRPAGGFVLWVEMPPVRRRARAARAGAAAQDQRRAGPIFSAKGAYRNFIRLNCGYPFTEEIERAIFTVGRLAGAMVRGVTPDVPDIAVRPATAAEVVDLRHAILRGGWRETAIFDGDDAATTCHFVAEHRNRIVGCVTLVPNAWQGDARVAVARDGGRSGAAGAGCGAVAAADGRRIRAIQRYAATVVQRPLAGGAVRQRHGWAVASDEFEIPTAGPHRKMTKSFAD